MAQIQKFDSKTQGRWTKQQHQMFLLGLQLYGRDWKKIEDYIGTRNGAQIRSHAQKFFLRMRKQFQVQPSNEELKLALGDASQTKLRHNTAHQSQESNEYSYFVEKIVKKTNQKEKFDFWQAFVDQRSCEEMHEMETGISGRKGSFMAWDQNELEAMSHAQPRKKVKTE